MRRIVLLLLIALTLPVLFAGCGSKASADVQCEGCKATIAQDMSMRVDGKTYCKACGPKMESAMGENADAKIGCAGGCGMTMAKANMNEIDGKFYCAGCAATAGQDHSGDDHSGHDHGGQ